jgi:hypothetical protein
MGPETAIAFKYNKSDMVILSRKFTHNFKTRINPSNFEGSVMLEFPKRGFFLIS